MVLRSRGRWGRHPAPASVPSHLQLRLLQLLEPLTAAPPDGFDRPVVLPVQSVAHPADMFRSSPAVPAADPGSPVGILVGLAYQSSDQPDNSAH
jgi:hypothetical protein